MKFKKYQSQARFENHRQCACSPCVLSAWKKVLDPRERGPCQCWEAGTLLELVGLGVLVDGFSRAHLIIAEALLFWGAELCFLG